MNENDYWRIRSQWQKRKETPSQIAARIIKFVNELQTAAPLIQKWYHWETEDLCIDLRDYPDRIENFVAKGLAEDENGDPEPHLGYHLQINNTMSDAPDSRTLILRTWQGATSDTFNSVEVKTPYGIDPDPSLLQYSIFKDLTLAIANAFEPDFICVYPTAMPGSSDSRAKSYARTPLISDGWMVYLSPSIAADANVPPSLIRQQCSNGGLFVAATDETFNFRNTKHRQQVFLMEGMLDPLNGVTWRNRDNGGWLEQRNVRLDRIEAIAADEEHENQETASKDVAWQRYISFLANPQNPTPAGMAYWLSNPAANTGKVRFGDYVKANEPNGIPESEAGDLVEAKGKFADALFTDDMGGNDIAWDKFKRQLKAQSNTLAIEDGGRKLFYCFESAETAAKARELFGEDYQELIYFIHCQ